MTTAGRVEARRTVPAGGAAFSASTGAHTSAVTCTVPAGNYYLTAAGGVSSLLTAVQTQLNENVQPYPLSAAAIGKAIGYGVWTNGVGYLCNESSGNLASAFGSPATLTAASSPTYSNAGPKGGIDKAVGFDSVLDGFAGGAGDLDVGATDDLIIAWVAYLSADLGSPTTNTIVTKSGAALWRLYMYRNSGSDAGIALHMWDGVDNAFAVTADTGAALNVGAWHCGLAVVERATNRARVATYNLSTGVTTVGTELNISTIGSMANAGNFTIGANTATTWQLAALYAVKGNGVATGMSTNLATAIDNFRRCIQGDWTVAMSETTGRVTISHSFWPSYVQFTNTTLRDNLGFEYDFDWPQTSAQVASAIGYGTWTSGAGWLCNESSGNLASVFGTPATLTVAASPTHGYVGPRGGVDKAVGFDSASDAFTGATTDVDVGASDDLIIAWAAYLTADLTALTVNPIVDKLGATGYRLYMYRNSGSDAGIALLTTDGVDTVYSVTTNSGAALNIGAWHCGLAVVDRSTNMARVATCNLTNGVTTVGSETSIAAVGSMSVPGTAFAVGGNVSSPWHLGALYIVKGSGVATGLSANLSTALSNWSTYLKSQTSTEQARGIWFPYCPINMDGDPAQAPRWSDLRHTRGPTGTVLALSGNSYRQHTNVVWSHVPIAQTWENEATYNNGSWEYFFEETQMGFGSDWFTAGSPVQIYCHDGTVVGEAYNEGAGVSGWYMVGVDKVNPKKSVGRWTGRWRIEIPELISPG